MISKQILDLWAKIAPWQTYSMIEQDLIISRALVCLYNNPIIQNNLVFRGGTALNKLYLNPPARYSEDIDFVQLKSEPIGPTINAIRNALKDWLGEPKRKITERGVKLFYTFQTVEQEVGKLKIEINTTEHFQVLNLVTKEHKVDSEWFSGKATITTYHLEELMGTKLRALYQRRKGRDLFDMWHICQQEAINIGNIIEIFEHYCVRDAGRITRDAFTQNMALKKSHADFYIDMRALLTPEAEWNFHEAFDYVMKNIIEHIPE